MSHERERGAPEGSAKLNGIRESNPCGPFTSGDIARENTEHFANLKTEPVYSTSSSCALAIARVLVAKDFAMLQRRHYRRSDACSTRAIAARAGVSQTVVQKWKNDHEKLSKVIPLAVLEVLPLELAHDLANTIFARRMGSTRGALAVATDGIERLAADMRDGRVHDVEELDDQLAALEQGIATLRREAARRSR